MPKNCRFIVLQILAISDEGEINVQQGHVYVNKAMRFPIHVWNHAEQNGAVNFNNAYKEPHNRVDKWNGFWQIATTQSTSSLLNYSPGLSQHLKLQIYGFEYLRPFLVERVSNDGSFECDSWKANGTFKP